MGQESDSVIQLVNTLRALREAVGESGSDAAAQEGWWQEFLPSVSRLCLAAASCIVDAEAGEPAGSGGTNDIELRYIYSASDSHDAAAALKDDGSRRLHALIHKAASNQYAVSMPARPGEYITVCVRLPHYSARYLVLLVEEVSRARLSEIVLRAQLVADIPGAVAGDSAVPLGAATGIATPQGSHQPLAGQLPAYAPTTLDLVVDIYRAGSFSTAAYALVNGLVNHCATVDTAVLGWEKDGYVRLIAISHFDKFEKKTEYVKLLEAAMEEAADQGHAIGHVENRILPENTLLSLAHRQLKIDTGCHAIMTLPLPAQESAAEDAVIMLISQKDDIESSFIHSVNVLAYLIRPRLQELKWQSENFFLRHWRGLKRGLGAVLGPNRLWSKVIAIVLAGLLTYGVFGTLPHRIEASATLTTENIRTVSAPFEGRIEHAYLNAGELVEAGQTLVQMETTDLLLQRSENQADRLRFEAEVSRARAEFNLIEAEISQARVAQSEARLERIDAHLARATIVSPIDGVVVEGERQDLLGIPVSQGESLYRIARIDDMYLRIRISEEDIHFINPEDSGEFVFLSQPGEKLPFTVRRIVPVARVEGTDGARFDVRGEFDVPAEIWWRPGMSGVVKIDQGRKPAAWVITHRLINRLRLWLWW